MLKSQKGSERGYYNSDYYYIFILRKWFCIFICWPINIRSRLIWLFTQSDWLKALHQPVLPVVNQNNKNGRRKCEQYKSDRNKTKNSRIKRNNTAQHNIKIYKKTKSFLKNKLIALCFNNSFCLFYTEKFRLYFDIYLQLSKNYLQEIQLKKS